MKRKTKVIVFVNLKGGVGKSASATSLSHILATVYGKKVLDIDLDPQANTSSMFCTADANTKDYLERLLVRKEFYSQKNSISTLMADANMDIHECIRHTEYENLDIIPSDLQLSLIENMLKADTLTPQQFRLKAHLEKIKGEYDYIILDCSPSVGLINVNGLAAADEVYIPVRADVNSIEGLAYARNLVDTVSTYNPNLKLMGCFFVAWEGRIEASRYLYNLLEEFIPELLIPIKISKSKMLAENTIYQAPLYAIDHGKNMSKATKSYLQLAEYIMAENKAEYLDLIKDEIM